MPTANYLLVLRATSKLYTEPWNMFVRSRSLLGKYAEEAPMLQDCENCLCFKHLRVLDNTSTACQYTGHSAVPSESWIQFPSIISELLVASWHALKPPPP